ncbi:MAG: TonB-dependent receptor [Treponema sp.]|jgi:iron complex outermembrane receptor protein|nr:TonB-dependent receptor [Treponema sp.]
MQRRSLPGIIVPVFVLAFLTLPPRFAGAQGDPAGTVLDGAASGETPSPGGGEEAGGDTAANEAGIDGTAGGDTAVDEAGVDEAAGEPLPADYGEVYRLPEAEVSAERDTPELITREEMERDGSDDLWEAVRYTPGVILSGGGRRNDSNFSVRGFGADSVPDFVDGIPLANPYRGEGDSARLLSGDLESVEIEKGYSSELLGANAIGGMVLLRTAKPREPLEASLKTALTLDGIGHYADSVHVLNLGTRLDYFYAKGVVQYRDTDHFRLPASFEPSPYNPQQPGDRLWSDSGDFKLTLTAGTTPLPDLDVWLTYVYQNAEKGVSPPDTATREYAIWDWPVWKRQSASLNGTYNTGPFSAEALFYVDKYDNRLDEYYNMKAFELGIHAPHSDYDEYSLGGRLKGGWEINGWNRIQAALTYKKEDHRGLRGNIANEDMTEEMHVNEDTWSAGAEYSVNPWMPLSLKAGFGFDALVPNEYRNQENEYLKLLAADYFIVKTRNMFLYTWQAGVFYAINPEQELRLTYARKNHFPTMARRYSTRFGSTLPNPNLGPEIANHFELGYRMNLGPPGTLVSAVGLNAAVYYSIVTGKIVTVELPNPHYPSALVDYARNLDKTDFWGVELAPEIGLGDWLNAGLAFSFNSYTINHSQSGVKVLPYYPRFTLNGYMVIKPLSTISVIPRLEYTGFRYADSEGASELAGYFLFHLKVSADIGRFVSVSGGIENIFDTYYEIRQYAPLAGRSFTVAVTLRYR